MKSVFKAYPQLITLSGLVPEHIVAKEVFSHEKDFQRWLADAKTRIKKVKIGDLFGTDIEREKIVLENFLGHWGNINIEEVCKIALITRFLEPKNVFEFGTYNGMTTLQLALNSPLASKVYTIDLPPKAQKKVLDNLKGIDRYVSKIFLGKFGNKVGSYFKGHKERKKIVQILHDAATYDYRKFEGKMKLIFIDAAHDYANKKIDSENALRMLAKGGAILWHNYADIITPEVTKYLAELSRTLPIYHLSGTKLAVYFKKNNGKR